jgi:hypothetical protein
VEIRGSNPLGVASSIHGLTALHIRPQRKAKIRASIANYPEAASVFEDYKVFLLDIRLLI